MIVFLWLALTSASAQEAPSEPQPAWDIAHATPRPLLRPLTRPANRLPVATQAGLPLPLSPYAPLPTPAADGDGQPLPEWRRLDAQRVLWLGAGGAAVALAAYGLVAVLGPGTRP